MKNIFLLFTALFMGFGATYAQTEKGVRNLGFNMALTHNDQTMQYYNPSGPSITTQNYKSTVFNVGPTLSRFIADNFDLGAALGYGYSSIYSNNNTSPMQQTNNSFSAQVYARKYFMYQNKIGIRTGPFVNFSHGKQSVVYSGSLAIYNSDSNTDFFGAGANLDLVFYPSKKLGISANIANIGYGHNSVKGSNNTQDSEDAFGLGFTNGLSLTLFYVWGAK
jgi:hypothetical protein